MAFNVSYQFQFLNSTSSQDTSNNIQVFISYVRTNDSGQPVATGSTGGEQWMAQLTLDLKGRPSIQLAVPLKSLEQRLKHASETAKMKMSDIVDSAVDVIDQMTNTKGTVNVLKMFHEHMRLGFPWLGEYDDKILEPVVLALLVFAGLRKSKHRVDDLLT